MDDTGGHILANLPPPPLPLGCFNAKRVRRGWGEGEVEGCGILRRDSCSGQNKWSSEGKYVFISVVKIRWLLMNCSFVLFWKSSQEVVGMVASDLTAEARLLYLTRRKKRLQFFFTSSSDFNKRWRIFRCEPRDSAAARWEHTFTFQSRSFPF